MRRKKFAFKVTYMYGISRIFSDIIKVNYYMDYFLVVIDNSLF